MLLFIGSSLTRRRQVSSGMNNVHEVVTIAITPNGSVALPFVIPSVAEGSAVQSFGPNEFVIPTGAKRSGGTCGSLDEHPIRPVAPFCSLGAYPDFLLAVLGRAACAVFCNENRMQFVDLTNLDRKSGR